MPVIFPTVKLYRAVRKFNLEFFGKYFILVSFIALACFPVYEKGLGSVWINNPHLQIEFQAPLNLWHFWTVTLQNFFITSTPDTSVFCTPDLSELISELVNFKQSQLFNDSGIKMNSLPSRTYKLESITLKWSKTFL